MTHDTITRLAPKPEALDPEWSTTTLSRILADRRPARRKGRRLALVAGVVVALTGGAAVAAGGPAEVVKDAILDFAHQPNTTGNGLGVLHDPELVAKFRTEHGLFAFWVATSSSGKVCSALTDGTWDGEGNPTKSELEYGCGETVVTNDGGLVEVTRVDQYGGFYKDDAGPIVYGVSPYPEATDVRVRGEGVDRTLPLRADSHGYGAAIPEASGAAEVTLTFLDSAGDVLGTKRLVAPVG